MNTEDNTRDNDYRKPQKKCKRMEYVLRWQGLKSDAPRQFAKSGEWRYYERKVALRDRAFYSRFYEIVDGPFPAFDEKASRYEDNRGRSR